MTTSLREFYVTAFALEGKTWGLSGAIECFEKHAGTDPERLDIKKITPQEIDAMVTAAIEAGQLASVAERYGRFLRRMLREIRPDEFPRRRRGRGKRQDPAITKEKRRRWNRTKVRKPTAPQRESDQRNPSVPRRGPGSWTADEWFRMLAAIKKMDQADERPHWRAFFLIARDTGLPRSSILALRRSGLAPNGTIVIPPELHAWEAVAHLKDDTMTALKATKGECLIAFPFETNDTFVDRWHEILKICGLNARPLWFTDNVSQKSESKALANAPPGKKGRPATLLEFYEKFYLPLKLGGRSKRTDVLYRYTIKNFRAYLGHTPTFDDLTDLTVSGLLESMRQKERAAPSVEKERAQLLAMWRFACRHHFVEEYPTIPPVILPIREPLAWMPEEMGRLFQAAALMEGKIGDIPKKLFWPALLWVLHETGERIMAVFKLEWKHFDLERGYVTIPAELRKGSRADKRSKLRPEAVAAVKRLIGHNRKYVFYFRLQPTYLWNLYEEVLKAAGLPTDRKSKFHRIRKTVASQYEAAGHNATELLGHSCRDVTRKYLDTRIVAHKHVADVLPNPFECFQSSRVADVLPSPLNGKDGRHED
jgi:integrase